jgi:hypothetical protein
MLNTLKIKLYNEFCYAQLKDSEDNQLDRDVTEQVIDAYVTPLNLPKEASIRDIGSGRCYFLKKMKELGYTNLVGTGVLMNELRYIQEQGFNLAKEDQQTFENVQDEAIDFVFARQVLQYSPMPFFALMEWNHKLKLKAHAYVEVPAAGQARQHEFAPGVWSILGVEQWVALFQKAGFEVVSQKELNYEFEHAETKEKIKDTHYSFLIRKQRPIDSK